MIICFCHIVHCTCVYPCNKDYMLRIKSPWCCVLQGTVKSKDTASAKPTAASAAAEDEGSPLVMSNKNQRAKDEQNLKVWLCDKEIPFITVNFLVCDIWVHQGNWCTRYQTEAWLHESCTMVAKVIVNKSLYITTTSLISMLKDEECPNHIFSSEKIRNWLFEGIISYWI